MWPGLACPNSNFICPSASCGVDIRYEISTTHDNTQASLTLVGPNGSRRELSSALTFQQSVNGGDSSFWMDGTGEYVFVLKVVGDQIGGYFRSQKSYSISISRRHDTTFCSG